VTRARGGRHTESAEWIVVVVRRAGTTRGLSKASRAGAVAPVGVAHAVCVAVRRAHTRHTHGVVVAIGGAQLAEIARVVRRAHTRTHAVAHTATAASSAGETWRAGWVVVVIRCTRGTGSGVETRIAITTSVGVARSVGAAGGSIVAIHTRRSIIVRRARIAARALPAR